MENFIFCAVKIKIALQRRSQDANKPPRWRALQQQLTAIAVHYCCKGP